jgi:integrase
MQIKRGSAVVKIYRDAKPTGTYYRVVYHLGGKRVRRNFNELEQAEKEAEVQASQLSRGDIDAMQLTGRDRLAYGRAVEAIKEFDTPLDAAAIEYGQARKLLNGVSLVDAARFYIRHHDSGITRKAVVAAVDEMIAAKKANGVSELYLTDLRYRLGAFKEAFRCNVNALVPNDVAQFFAGLKLSPRSFNNFLRALRTFFAYAQKQGWLSKEADLLARVDKRKEKSAPVEIFTSAELTELLQHASADLAPCLALGAFAGLRSEEILRLEWADIDRRPGFIEIAADKAKTATRRLVPISNNLALWLALAPRTEGRVWRLSKPWFFESIRDTVVAINGTRQEANGPKFAPFTWKQNALRHSFISHRLAEIQDVNRVALEAGNSPQMLFRHYRELVTPGQAASWFAISPNAPANVVRLPQRSA